MKIRSGVEAGSDRMEDDEDDVELEKSNVLLMGPTGSGIMRLYLPPYFLFFIFQFPVLWMLILPFGKQERHYLQRPSLVLSMFHLSLQMQRL